jgi:hypothetical protein
MYYIYHIPGVKIGCTSQLEIRTQSQGFSEYNILEEHFDIYIASDREITLQKQYGYKVDTIPYWKTMEAQLKSNNKKSRIKALKSRGKVKDVLSEMGKVGGLKMRDSGKLLIAVNKSASLPRSEKQIEHAKIIIEKMRIIAAELKRKPIIATNLKTGEKLYFNSTAEARIYLNDTSICSVLKGRYKQSKGYYYEYK